MIFSSDYPNEILCKKPKGMKVILQECGLWILELKAFCDKNNVMRIIFWILKKIFVIKSSWNI